MASFSKQIKKLVASGHYSDALELVEETLQDSPDDVQVLSIKAGILKQLKKNDEAIATLRTVTKLDGNKMQVWTALAKLYQENKDWQNVLVVMERIILLAEESKDEAQIAASQELFQNFIQDSMAGGTPNPNMFGPLLRRRSPISSLIPSTHSVAAALDLIDIEKKALKDRLAKLAAKSKMNISWTAAKIRAEKLAIHQQAPLPNLYDIVISQSSDDDARRKAESDLLQFLYDILLLLPPKEKAEQRDKIKDLADGMVLFDPRAPLAFQLHWDWSDFTDYSQLEPFQLMKYVELFPDTYMAQVIEGFLHSTLSPFDVKSLRQQEELAGPDFELYEEDWSPQLIADTFATIGDQNRGPFVLRILTDFYVQNEDWLLAVETAKQGLDQVQQIKNQCLVALSNTENSFTVLLAKAYTHFQAPRNFPAAEQLFDSVLDKVPDSPAALIGKGIISVERKQWDSAREYLEKALESHPDDIEALTELNWCLINSNSDIDKGIEGLKKCLKLSFNLKSTYGSARFRAETRWRIGYAYWHYKNEPQLAFESFVAALEETPNLAAAYTSLGLFYQSQNDRSRAIKCFYKALEVDNGQLIAGEQLASDFADSGQWSLVKVVASLVLKSDKMSTSGCSWPYRTMGIVSLNERDFAQAVKFFQKSLRLEPNDSDSWVGLGEAYIASGRYQSAEKALQRALHLTPNNFSALYGLSCAQRAVLNFPAAAESIKKAMQVTSDSQEGSSALDWALIYNSVLAAEFYLSKSLVGDAIDESSFAIEAILTELKRNPEHTTVWDVLVDAMGVLAAVEGSGENIRDKLNELAEMAKLPRSTIDGDDLLSLRALFALKALSLCDPAKKSELAMRHHHCSIALRSISLEEAISHSRQSIALIPRSYLYWRTYGILLSRVNPEVAQHSLVRSLALEGKDPESWIALGSLYLDQGDEDLASEAFDRALSVDPDNYRAWTGQALVDSFRGKDNETVLKMFLHASSLAPGEDTLANQLLGFQGLACKNTDIEIISGLKKLLALNPTNTKASLALTLLLERRGDYGPALETLPTGHSGVEARLNLALGEYQKAIDAANDSLAQDDVTEIDEINALLVAGLAYFFVKDFDSSIDMFTTAMDRAESDERDILEMLVQVLHASGNADCKQTAIDQLYDSIARDGAHLPLVLLLGVIGFCDGDQEVIEAARDEIEQLINKGITPVSQLARACRVLSKLDGDSVSCYQRAVFENPGSYELWKQLSPVHALTLAECNQIPSQLSEAYAATGDIDNVRRAIFLEPASTDAWRAYKNVAVNPTAIEELKITE